MHGACISRLERVVAALAHGEASRQQPDARLQLSREEVNRDTQLHHSKWVPRSTEKMAWPELRANDLGGRWIDDTAGGILRIERSAPSAPGLGEYAYGGCCAELSSFSRDLAGAHGVRFRCGPKEHEAGHAQLDANWKPGGPGDLVEAFSVTIGSFRGAVMGPGADPEGDRGVQLHFDWLQSGGLIFYMVRGALASDSETYPIDAYGQPSLDHLDAGAQCSRDAGN